MPVNPLYPKWRNSSLEGHVYAQLQGLLDSAIGPDPRVAVRRREIVVTLQSAEDREQLMERLRTTRLPESLPTEVQLRMEMPS